MNGDRFNEVPDLTVAGEISVGVTSTGVKNGFLDLQCHNRDGTMCLDVDEARQLHEWLGKALPAHARGEVQS